jgi:hypothetical protein
VVPGAGDQQFALGADKCQHLLAVNKSYGFEMFRSALAARWACIKRE